MVFVTLRRRLIGYFALMTLIPLIGMIIASRFLGSITFDMTLRELLRSDGFVHPALVIVTIIWTIALLTLALSFILSDTIARPLRTMVAYAEHLARGERHHPLHIHSHDRELHALANALSDLRGQLQTHEVQLQQQSADAAQGELATQVGHDMRSPTAVLRMMIQALRNPSALTVSTTEVLRNAEVAVEKLETMALGLLDVAQAKRLTLASTDLAALTHTVVAEVRAGLANREVAVRIIGGDSIVAQVDREKLNRVLTNLVQNAVQAIPQDRIGEVAIEITDDAAHEHCVIRVRDNGCGIAPEHRTKLFHKYFTTKGAKGNGLGLAYCHDVIAAHGGMLDVESAVGVGTCFTLRLPQQASATGDVATDVAVPLRLVKG